MQRCFSVLIVLGLAASWGCGDLGGSRRNASGAAGGAGLVDPSQQVSQPAAAAGTPATGQVPAAPAASALSVAAGQLGQGANPPQANQPSPAAAATPPAVVQEKAQAGVTGKGDYGGPGIVTTPIGTYFQARERIVFEIAIPGAMRLYDAEKGYKPKTQEDFMRDIIQANMIKLPELPPGHKYVYDPKKGELMVEHPQ
ncbi:MAG TPA: hypothetical protein VN699_21300 [Pirellulales bacterium]|nr:hypothetical protein [Pirellulales bacterium]